ncbi:ankyrin repeat-rich membrane spanning isoform X3 [Rhodnius prolixus]|uniref:ankyrin repeat-rich membrane spanning isoform X3 n=1 Tax=Rhodnius prolixus TaxID=13249 RepID=UPI003D188BAF
MPTESRILFIKTLNRSESMVSLCNRALVNFIIDDDLQGLQVYLENKRGHVDDKDANGATALHFAATKGKINFVRALILQNADVNAEDQDQWTPLLCATKEGYLDICQELLDRDANIEHRDMGGWSALMWASYKGHTDIALMLLERGADHNAHGNYHISSLLWAAGRGHTAIAKALIEHGAKVNVGDKYGTTALVWAARKGNKEIVDLLIKAGANVDTAGMHSWTALLVATMGNHIDVVMSLLQCRPNVNAVDKDGCSALTIACKEGFTEIAVALLAAGAYINIQDRSGDTNLIHAVKGGHRSIIDALLKRYADVDIPGKERKTVTYTAIEKGNIPVLKMLLTANPDLEIATKDGDTPLLRAVRNRNAEAVQLLLERKAKVSAVDRWGDTVLHIAMRARSKAVVEILLRNPKHSQLLYRPNRAGETPYNIDMAHAKTILGRIFGDRRLNTSEDSENFFCYELYSSAIADMLSEPSLTVPIVVGLYAKWGSGKSFLLNKLREEMTNFARQWSQQSVHFSWVLMIIMVHIALIAGVVAGLSSWSWMFGVLLCIGLIIFSYTVLILLWYFSHRYSWDLPYNLSVAVIQRMNLVKVILQVIFCHPPGSQWNTSVTAQPIKFYFTDQTRIGNTATGENSVVQMIGSLYDSIEADHGILATRLFRAFRPKPLKSTSSWRWRRVCCVPNILLFEGCFLCILVIITILTVYFVELPLPEEEKSLSRTTIELVCGICGGLVLVAITANIYTIGQLVQALIFSQRKHVQRAVSRLETIKSEGFLECVRAETSLMTDMVKSIDGFTRRQTRLVIVVDGLEACDRDKVLLILDAVHTLFSDANSPFIVILAIDPHVISKAVESKSRRILSESNIGGHDYLRNVVHLPFYLQKCGLQGLKVAQKSSQSGGKKASLAPSIVGTGQAFELAGSMQEIAHQAASGSGRRSSKIDGNTAAGDGGDKLKPPGGSATSVSGVGKRSSRKLKASESIASSIGSNLNRAGGGVGGGPNDLSGLLLTDDYFSDITPRSMNRLMNIVYITARLLKASGIEFNWYHLTNWINITEQWPYHTSWIIFYIETSQDSIDETASLKSIYDKVHSLIPVSKEAEPLLELDRDERKLDVFLTFHRTSLTVADLRVFLPFTINLDPYVKKVIKDDQQNIEDGLVTISPARSQPWEAWPSAKIASFRKQKTLPHQDSVGGMTSAGYSTVLSTPTASVIPASSINRHWQQPQPMGPSPLAMPMQRHPHIDRITEWVTPPHPEMIHPIVPALPAEISEVQLENLSVAGVCQLITRLTDLQQSQVANYIATIQTNNINGRVLLHCNLADLKAVLNMSFGDWEMFRIVIMRLREKASAVQQHHFQLQDPIVDNSDYNRSRPSMSGGGSNASNGNPSSAASKQGGNRGQQDDKQQQQSHQTSSTLKQLPTSVEKQVTMEEQMICGALQTLNEEAMEDVLEDGIAQQLLVDTHIASEGDLTTLRGRISRAFSQSSFYSSPPEESDVILLQTIRSQAAQIANRSQTPDLSTDSDKENTPILHRRRRRNQSEGPGAAGEATLSSRSISSSRPNSLHLPRSRRSPTRRSLSADYFDDDFPGEGEDVRDTNSYPTATGFIASQDEHRTSYENFSYDYERTGTRHDNVRFRVQVMESEGHDDVVDDDENTPLVSTTGSPTLTPSQTAGGTTPAAAHLSNSTVLDLDSGTVV